MLNISSIYKALLPSSVPVSCIFSRSFEALLTTSECIVRLSGANSLICESVSLKSPAVSPGRPAIKSIFILSNPFLRARLKASAVCLAVCLLPIISNVFWCMVCGFTDILPVPCLRSTFNFSSVILSGLPASTVNSTLLSTGKYLCNASKSLESCHSFSATGVPPPIYTLDSFLSLNICDEYSISLNSASK